MKPPVPDSCRSAADRAALISSLVDGDSDALRAGCDLWRDDAQARRDWHTFHLIGDVLRSEGLAASPARDAAFLAALRSRLAQEPAVLAPQPVATVARRARWPTPVAALAGIAAVAGVLGVMRLAAPVADGPAVAVGHGAGLTLTAQGAPAAQPLVIEGRLIRDERLDAYLRAHREASGGLAVAVPGGMPRSIETLAPAMPVAAPVAR